MNYEFANYQLFVNSFININDKIFDFIKVSKMLLKVFFFGYRFHAF